MKKIIFISIGILLVITVLAIWAYLFTFGTPQSRTDVFTNFGIGTSSNETVSRETSVVDVQDVTPSGNIQNLKQLTTRPVAGAVFVADSIRYVEQGTGHVYQISTVNGSESLLSGTTFPGTREALFSKDGSFIALTLLDGTTHKVIVGALPSDQNGSFVGKSLPVSAHDLSFSEATGTIRYLLAHEEGVAGYAYDVRQETSSRLFQIPLTDVRVLWGEPVYVYTTPTKTQSGYIYEALRNGLRSVSVGMTGLSAFIYKNSLVLTSLREGTVTTSLLASGALSSFPLPLIPEKCISGSIYIYCAVPIEIFSGSYPDEWYKGSVSYTDVLWRVEESGRATALSNFKTETGREVDVSNIGIAPDESALYFINKNDNALWMFDLQ